MWNIDKMMKIALIELEIGEERAYWREKQDTNAE